MKKLLLLLTVFLFTSLVFAGKVVTKKDSLLQVSGTDSIWQIAKGTNAKFITDKPSFEFGNKVYIIDTLTSSIISLTRLVNEQTGNLSYVQDSDAVTLYTPSGSFILVAQDGGDHTYYGYSGRALLESGADTLIINKSNEDAGITITNTQTTILDTLIANQIYTTRLYNSQTNKLAYVQDSDGVYLYTPSGSFFISALDGGEHNYYGYSGRNLISSGVDSTLIKQSDEDTTIVITNGGVNFQKEVTIEDTLQVDKVLKVDSVYTTYGSNFIAINPVDSSIVINDGKGNMIISKDNSNFEMSAFESGFNIMEFNTTNGYYYGIGGIDFISLTSMVLDIYAPSSGNLFLHADNSNMSINNPINSTTVLYADSSKTSLLDYQGGDFLYTDTIVKLTELKGFGGHDFLKYSPTTTTISRGDNTFMTMAQDTIYLHKPLKYVVDKTALGELSVANGSTAQSIPTGATYEKLTAFTTVGDTVEVTAVADSMVIRKAGYYFVKGSFSLSSGTVNVNTFGALFIDGIEQSDIHYERKIATTGDVGSCTMSGLVYLNIGDVLDVRMRHEDGSAVDITVHYANLSIMQIK